MKPGRYMTDKKDQRLSREVFEPKRGNSFFVFRHGIKEGPLSMEEVREKLESKQLLYTDLVSTDITIEPFPLYQHQDFDRRNRNQKQLPQNPNHNLNAVPQAVKKQKNDQVLEEWAKLTPSKRKVQAKVKKEIEKEEIIPSHNSSSLSSKLSVACFLIGAILMVSYIKNEKSASAFQKTRKMLNKSFTDAEFQPKEKENSPKNKVKVVVNKTEKTNIQGHIPSPKSRKPASKKPTHKDKDIVQKSAKDFPTVVHETHASFKKPEPEMTEVERERFEVEAQFAVDESEREDEQYEKQLQAEAEAEELAENEDGLASEQAEQEEFDVEIAETELDDEDFEGREPASEDEQTTASEQEEEEYEEEF